MDYEKAYNNLVAKVKFAHLFAQTDSTKNVLEDILPELRETEDERIRKKLYNTILGTPDDSTWFDGTSKEAMLDWVERQKLKWGEEDENRLKAVLDLIENTSAIHPNYSRRKLIIWLNDLRPIKPKVTKKEDEE